MPVHSVLSSTLLSFFGPVAIPYAYACFTVYDMYCHATLFTHWGHQNFMLSEQLILGALKGGHLLLF